jgi:hypothetical protein
MSFSLAGCAKNDPTYTAAPPTPQGANPVVLSSKKHFMGQMGLNKMGQSSDVPKGTRHE